MALVKKNTLALEKLRSSCGLTVMDVHRISDVSRATLHKIERGEAVRLDTLSTILQKLYRHPKCNNAATLIADEMGYLGISRADNSLDRTTLDRMEAADDELNMLLAAGKGIENPKFVELLVDIRSSIDELLALKK